MQMLHCNRAATKREELDMKHLVNNGPRIPFRRVSGNANCDSGFLQVIVHEVKRDDSSFASDTGGPVAKSDKNSAGGGKSNSGSSSSSSSNSPFDLEPCELMDQNENQKSDNQQSQSQQGQNQQGQNQEGQNQEGQNQESQSQQGQNQESQNQQGQNQESQNQQQQSEHSEQSSTHTEQHTEITKEERRVRVGQRSAHESYDANSKRWRKRRQLPSFAAPSAPKGPADMPMPKGPAGMPTSPQDFSDKMGELFKACQARTHKRYNSQEVAKAAEQFPSNLKTILQIQASRISPFDAQVDTSKFCDINFDDFKKLHTGVKLPDVKSIRKVAVLPSLKKQRPQKVQWTAKNVFPPARDQGTCGSCYAVSTADLLAAQSKIEAKNWDGDVTPLSPQYIVDCMSEPNAYKCDGGRPVNIINGLASCGQKKKKGCMLPTESCYPYTNSSGTCKKSCAQGNVKISSANMLDIRGPQEKEIMASLLQWGPVIAIVGLTEVWQFYNGSGIIRPRQCTEEQMHAVVVTGYDYSKCVPTYTVRNSWGTDWGGKGYVKLEAGKNTCGIGKSIVFACSSKCGQNEARFQYISQNPNYPED